MPKSKQHSLQALKDAREELWSILATLDDHMEIYPGWQKREFFAHIAGWEAMVFDIIQRHLTRQTPADYGYTDVDSANERFVNARKSASLQDVLLECEINRFAIQTLLAGIENFNDAILFPWGVNTVTEFVQGAVEHERSHAADIV